MARKLKLQMQISLDGFVSTGPNDEQKWVTWAWEEIREDVLSLLDSCDTHIIGRKLAADYLPYWQNTFTTLNDPMHEVAKRIVAFNKIVFTKTLDKSLWEKTILIKGNLKEEVKNLKNQSGKDIFAVGGSLFVSELIMNGLIDEFHFFVNPIALGNGVPIFHKLKSNAQLILKKSKAYKCGINLLIYELK